MGNLYVGNLCNRCANAHDDMPDLFNESCAGSDKCFAGPLIVECQGYKELPKLHIKNEGGDVPVDVLEKPPLGAKPAYVAAEQRINELAEAITRHTAIIESNASNIKMWAKEIILQVELLEKMVHNAEEGEKA